MLWFEERDALKKRLAAREAENVVSVADIPSLPSAAARLRPPVPPRSSFYPKSAAWRTRPGGFLSTWRWKR